MERVTKKKTIEVMGVFTPSVKIGMAVRPNDILGSSRVPTLLETHSLTGGKVLVDDGMFVSTMTPLVEYRKGFRKEVSGSTHEGIVKISKTVLSIIAEDRDEQIVSNTWGRILSVSESSYVVEVKYLKMPIFVSKGHYIETTMYCMLQKGLNPSHC